MKRAVSREALVAIALLAFAMFAVSSVRRHLWAADKRVKTREDVYFLPPPEQVARLSLGYKQALADALWAHVLVSQGLHSLEERRFPNLLRLYDVINLLAPTWRTPYLLADALITFQAGNTPYEEVVKAREILELGTRHRPFDAEIWLNLGQFVSFLAPSSYLDELDPAIAARWRAEGVVYLERAAELGGGNSNIAWQALGGASILENAGEHDAAIRFLQRTYAVTDDDELKKDILERLERRMAQRDLDAFKGREKSFVDLYSSELPFITRNQALVLGPPPAPARCAGPGHAADARCASDWNSWFERTSQQEP